MSHQQLGHTKMGPQFKVSSKGLRIHVETPALVVHYTTATPVKMKTSTRMPRIRMEKSIGQKRVKQGLSKQFIINRHKNTQQEAPNQGPVVQN